MRVVFRTRQLERCFEEEREVIQSWGPVVARRYIGRILLLQGAVRLNDLLSLASLRLHGLRGGRAGQYAMTLQGRWRLIITMTDDTATIEEVSNHYDD